MVKPVEKDSCLALRLVGLPRRCLNQNTLAAVFGRIGPLRRCLIERRTGEAYIEYWFAREAEQAWKYFQRQQLGELVTDDADVSLRAALVRPSFQLFRVPACRGRDPRSTEALKVEPAQRHWEGSLPMRTVRVRRRDGAVWSPDQESRFQAVLQRYGHESWTNAHQEPSTSAASSYGLRERELVLPTWIDARNVCGILHDLTLEAGADADRSGLCANILGVPTTKLCRIIVRNLPFTFPEKELLTQLREYGPLAAVSLPRRALAADEHAEHRCYAGYAFAEYFVKADANAAVQRLNGATFHGRVLAVDRAVCRERYQERQRQATDTGAVEDPSRDTSVPKSPATSIRQMQTHQQGEQTRKRPQDSQTIAQGAKTSSDSDDRENPERKAFSPWGSAVHQESCQADSITPCEGSSLSNKRVRRHDRPSGGDKQFKDNEEMRSRTLFVRNVPLDATADELKTLLETHGGITYCVLVRDPLTGLARGSAFVCFAERVAAERIMNQVTSTNAAPLSLEQAPIQLHGRALRFSWALSRTEAALLPQQRFHAAASERNDRRNLYLALEGVIDRNHPAAKGLSEAELALREKLEQTKRQKLLRNPHTFVSRTLLTVHNVPRGMNERQLKALFARAGQESPAAKPATIKQVRIAHERNRKQRACAYAFIEFREHEAAQRALRALNNNPDALPAPHQGRRLIVQFAIEDERKLRILAERRQSIATRSKPNTEEHTGPKRAPIQQRKASSIATRSKPNTEEHTGPKRAPIQQRKASSIATRSKPNTEEHTGPKRAPIQQRKASQSLSM